MTRSLLHRADFVWNDPSHPFCLVEAEQISRDRPFAQQVDVARQKLAQRNDDAVIAGAAPFDPDSAGLLWVGTPSAFTLPRSTVGQVRRPSQAVEVEQHLETSAVTPRDVFIASVEKALRYIDAGVFDKVVMSRAVEVVAQVDFDLDRLLARLAQDSSALSFSLRDDDRRIIGASPEILVSKRGAVVQSGPLAGSTARKPGAREDVNAGDALLRSSKDLAEHACVVDDIADRLQAVGKLVIQGPHLFGTAFIWHLASSVVAHLGPSESRDSLAFADLLHPTAAVCGLPGETARRFIREVEERDRGFYTGYVGWQNKRGDGDWRIILRAANVYARCAILDVGAGIVRESEPASEFAETALKLRPMLQALGASFDV